MGVLSDLFSGKKRREDALDRLKMRAAAYAVAGMTLLSPMKAGAQEMADSLPQKPTTELAVEKTPVVKFADSNVQKLADRMMKTETGKTVLTELSALKVGVRVTSDVPDNLGGYYSPSKKEILINSSCSSDLQASILVHEGTHALQAARGCRVGPYLNMYSYFALNKAMEADAVKNQIFAADELRELGDKGPYNAFKRDHSDLIKSYEAVKEKYGAQRDSVAKYTMLAYYNDRSYVKNFYEDQYVKALQTFVNAVSKKNPVPVMNFNFSEKDIIDRVCQLGGKAYMNACDTTLLQSSACNYVQKSTYKALEGVSKDLAKKVKKDSTYVVDTSYKGFYVVNTKGEVNKEIGKGAVTTTANPAVVARFVSTATR